MRIRLLADVPVNKRHNMTKGRVVETVRDRSATATMLTGVTVLGYGNKRIRVLAHEYEKVDNTEPLT